MDESFDLYDPATWPDTHCSGIARDLADRIDDVTMDALSYAYDTTADGPADFDHVSFAFWQMLLTHEAILFAATGTTHPGPTQDTVKGLADRLRDEDRQGDGVHLYFSIRLRQRMMEGG